MRLRPGYMSFELSNMTPALARVVVLKSWFWMTEHHKVGIFVKEQKFAFGNSQFTRQHNISLIVTNKYRRPGEEQLTKLFTSVISHQLGGRRVDFKFDWEKKMGKVRWNKWQQFPWTKKVVSRTATLLFDSACILKQKTNTIFAVSVTVRLRVQIRVSWLTSDELDFIPWVFRSLQCFRMEQSQWFCLLD